MGPVTRVGFGFDLHPLAAGRPLVLGGVTVESDRGLAGHSDADVLSHAVGEALLGALALGDLGRHFPDTDPRYRGISSLRLLRSVVDLVTARGHRRDFDIYAIDAPERIHVQLRHEAAAHESDPDPRHSASPPLLWAAL